MEEEELRELGRRERDQAIGNIKDMIKEERLNDIWLLYKDKFDLENVQVCTPMTPRVSPSVLIPFYDKVLFMIEPIPTPEKFRKAMGCSIDQILEWRNRGWIETILDAPLQYYRHLDYLDRLIAVSPDFSIRGQEYISTLAGGKKKFNEIFKKGKEIFPRNINSPAWYQQIHGKKRGQFIFSRHLASIYTDMVLFGFIKNAKDVEALSKIPIQEAAGILLNYSLFLFQPFHLGLKKTIAYPSAYKSFAQKYSRRYRSNKETIFVPFGLMDVYRNLTVNTSPYLDTDQIEVIRNNSKEFIKAFNWLDEKIGNTVRDKFEGGGLDRGEEEIINVQKEELRRTWNESVKRSFEEIKTRKKMIALALTGSIVAPAVVISALRGAIGYPEILQTLTASGVIYRAVDPVADYLLRFWEAKPIHVDFYEVSRDLKKLKK